MKIIRKLKLVLPIVLIMVSIMVSTSLAASVEGIIIDHFEENQAVSFDLPTTTSFSSLTPAPSALGNERDIYVTNATGAPGIGLLVESNAGGISMFTVNFDVAVTADIQVQWDGLDNSEVINTNLSPALDFISAGYDRFTIGIPSADTSFSITMQVYDNSGGCSEITTPVPGPITPANPAVVEFLFSNFSDCSGFNAADLTDIGAIVMNIPGVVSMDLAIHFVQLSSGNLDFSDAPDTYGTLLSNNGARHTLTNDIYLGATVEPDDDGDPNVNANSPLHQDEDGVRPVVGSSWSDGTGEVLVDVSGTEPGCLSLWTDFSTNDGATPPDGVFDLRVDRRSVTQGLNQLVEFTLPNNIADGEYVYVRVRVVPDLYDMGCQFIQPIPATGPRFGGEVEDYRWGFQPTAVELVSIEANTNAAVPFVLLSVALILLVGGGALFAYKRRRV